MSMTDASKIKEDQSLHFKYVGRTNVYGQSKY